MRNVLLLETANDFNDHGTATLVITTEHGRLIRSNDIAFNDRFDAFAGNDGVHVRTHHDRFSALNRASEARNDVAGIAADFFVGVVNLNLRSDFFAVLLDLLSYLAFFARVAVDLHT